jgi:ubiquinone/menaquinone biosynthesis C-methylase UbiE
MVHLKVSDTGRSNETHEDHYDDQENRWPPRSLPGSKQSEGNLSKEKFSTQVTRFAQAPCIETLPEVIGISSVVPLNPPEAIQMKFVGLSYESAYAEAETFVKVADEFAAKHARGGFASLDRIVDFGSGWGRITRTLLEKVPATKVHALDVDSQMTALVNTTLPGVNALTISPEPPTILGDASVDALVAFSVFSHLSGPAHEAWAREIGRVVAPGGFAAVTVLDQAFFGQIAGAQAAVKTGKADSFAESLAKTFGDLVAAQAGYNAGEIQYAASGGGEVRTGDYYGWAAAPSKYVERVWGAAGFRLVEWVPSGVLFPQALVFMVRQPNGGAVGATAAVRAKAAKRNLVNRIKQIISKRS